MDASGSPSLVGRGPAKPVAVRPRGFKATFLKSFGSCGFLHFRNCRNAVPKVASKRRVNVNTLTPQRDVVVVRIPPLTPFNLSGAHSEFKKKDSLLASMSDKNRRKFERICKEIGEENTQILMEYITFKKSENIGERG